MIHEEGHYISALFGREILGMDRKYDKGMRTATSTSWEGLRDKRYKDPEVGEFHEKILRLVSKLSESMPEWMKDDTKLDER